MDTEKPGTGSVCFPFEVLVVAAAALIFAAAAVDAAMGAEATSPQTVEREVIPGADKMTAAERENYRRRMAAAATPEEKARIRAEYAPAVAKAAPAPKLVGDPARGAELHRGCFGCHGPEGRGLVSNPGSFKGFIPPWDGEDYTELVRNSAEFAQWVRRGVSDRFQANPAARTILATQAIRMPAYGDRVSDEELRDLEAYVAWVRAHPRTGTVP